MGDMRGESQDQAEAVAVAEQRTIDWPRVARAVYQVRQHYRYTYTGPVTDLRQQLIMIPPLHHRDQHLRGRSLDVRGTSGEHSVRWDTDRFGNRLCRVHAERVENAVDFEVEYCVERYAHDPAPVVPVRLADSRLLRLYCQPTGLTAPDDRLRAAASAIAGLSDDARERAELAHDWAAGAITYQFGITGVQTPAAMALALGRGVCQDYAHILLAVLRLLQIPARYVSGHLLGEGAPHAWVEALFDDAFAPGGLDVVPYDPTHRRRAGLNYITVAVGRDFSDVTPTSGYFTGTARGQLSASKHADILECEYADAGAGEGVA
jgi:transglutaminase-like putative cysteine protease